MHPARPPHPNAALLNPKFAVNGTNIPLYDYDLGASYAGLLPIAQEYRVDPNGTDARELFFWFFPSENPATEDEITIWFTGGPGCSSLVASLQENGPFLWQPTTAAPFPNPWSWNKLTNIVYVEGRPGCLLKDETDVAQEFLGFWKNFMEAFELQGRKVIVAGESYAGYYIPYIADAMLNANDTRLFNVDVTYMVDPIVGNNDAQQQEFPHVFPLNDTFEAELAALDETCGFTAFLEWLAFPPKGVQPASPTSDGECDNTYHITTSCPYAVDPVTNPPEDGLQYFNRADVKAAINAPQITWRYCRAGTFAAGDQSTPPSFEVLPRTVIASGKLVLTLPSNGTLLAIQIMTWNGVLGFQSVPADPFFRSTASPRTLMFGGVMGTLHAERGLTFVDVFLAGHQLPEWQPAAEFRQLEYVLGRVESMSGTENWTVTI
ncbi:Alpha/Beta hydrolase protein [Mycena capillaripes]|nr:Alpha/Beta hydrolase protein [Mycena capillaripes]